MVTTCHLYSAIHILFVSHAIIIIRQIIYPSGMRSCKPSYYFMKFFMFRESISWDHFLYLSYMFICSSLLIISWNGWETKSTRTDDSKIVTNFIKSNIFSRFGIPRNLISDRGTHFYSQIMKTLLKKYHVTQKFSTAYHLRASGQVEVFHISLALISVFTYLS